MCFNSVLIPPTSMNCQWIMLLNLNSRRSGIQTDLCPFIKVRRSMWPLLPWPSIWIHSEMSDTGRAICAPPPLKSWEGHVSHPSSDPRWHVINSEMSDIGRVTCAPPPLLKLWEGLMLPSLFPLLIHSENCFTGWATCAPFSKVRRGTCPLFSLILLNFILSGRDAWH